MVHARRGGQLGSAVGGIVEDVRAAATADGVVRGGW